MRLIDVAKTRDAKSLTLRPGTHARETMADSSEGALVEVLYLQMKARSRLQIALKACCTAATALNANRCSAVLAKVEQY